MKDKIFSYTKDRSFWTNLIIAVICFILMFIFPQALAILLNKVISNMRLCVIIGNVIFIVLLYLMYFKDLNHEAAVYFKDFKNKFKHSIKIYFLGFGLMVFFNLFIVMFLKEI